MTTVIVILVVTAAFSASVAALRRQWSRRASSPPMLPSPALALQPKKGALLPIAKRDIVSFDGTERWLSGALWAGEVDVTMSALFFGPDGTRSVAIAAFAAPRTSIWWLSPRDITAPLLSATSIDVDGRIYRRTRRLPVQFSREGTGVPPFEGDGVWVEYEAGARDVLLVITQDARTAVFEGIAVQAHQYEVLGNDEPPEP